MNDNYQPVIVVVAYNRTFSLKRILGSLSKAFIPDNTKLIISIDNNGMNQEVADLAYDYEWKFGEKEVIYHKERQGLKNHIIKCGDFSLKYGSVIIFEDDLYVSPYFYDYAIKAISFYNDDEKIAGISLYNQPYTESVKLPFIPIEDDSDVYFVQIASSYGQLWTSKQWTAFKQWYNSNPDINDIHGLPMLIKKWPESSWKKYFCAYLVKFNRFFVFPQLSLTSNYNDLGTHMKMKTYFGQAPLKITNSNYRFKNLNDSINIYDAYHEIEPSCLNKLSSTFLNYDYEVDLYGKKENFIKSYVLTTKPCSDSIHSFERSLKPHELNVIFNLAGDEIFFARNEHVLFYPRTREHLKNNRTTQDFINDYTYFYSNVFDSNVLMKIMRLKVKNKIISFFKRDT